MQVYRPVSNLNYIAKITALLSVQNNILHSMGQCKVTDLTLLDLLATFGTIDHTILIDRLQDWLRIEGIALNWIVSYITGRCQTMYIQGNLSVPISLFFGVPQGFDLGPLLFMLE